MKHLIKFSCNICPSPKNMYIEVFMKKLFCAIVLLLSSFAQAGEKQLQLESGSKTVQLIELYSSEGCSSCPPAERYLRNLRQKKGLWTTFVPVEFHVDYWNSLGWTDPFCEKRFSQRQRLYAYQLGMPTVYTPGFFFHGREWRQWSYEKIRPSKIQTGNLKVIQKGSEYLIEYRPRTSEKKKLRAFGALLGNGMSNQVKSGENKGRELVHDFVVLVFTNGRMKKIKAGYQTSLTLKKRDKVKPKSYSVAFWVSEEGNLIPLQATGGDL